MHGVDAPSFASRATGRAPPAGLLLAIPTLLRHIPPSLINIPYRSYWLVPARVDEARRKLVHYMDWFSVADTLLLVVVLEFVLQANVHRTGLDESVMLPLLNRSGRGAPREAS